MKRELDVAGIFETPQREGARIEEFLPKNSGLKNARHVEFGDYPSKLLICS